MSTLSTRSGLRTFTAVIAVIFAVILVIGGAWLAVLGGSYYYVISGIALLISAILLARRSTAAIWLYAVLMLVTLVWGLWEAGTDFWALVPRLNILGLLGIWLLIPGVTRGIGAGLRASKTFLSATLVLSIAVLVYSIFNDPQEINGSLASTQPAQAQPVEGISPADWPAYGRTQSGTRYSPLNQVNENNVKDLQVAWTFRSGESRTENDSGETTNELTPIKIGDNMYICTTHQILVALDPATGKEKWRFDPKLKSEPSYQHLTCRGVSYYDQANTTEFAASLAGKPQAQTSCPRKVFLPVNDGRLFAINADNGQPCSEFANNGELDLKEMHPYTYPGGLQPTSPPVVTGTTVIIGGSVTDNFSIHEPSGAIRGYDVNTGALQWIFDTGAEDPNAIPTDGKTLVNNSPNAWAPLAYDAAADVVYVPTGNATPDIWGGHRTPLMERYASAIVALNGSTGKLVWSYQTTHHDLWDMDVGGQPTLVDIKTEGGVKPALMASTKQGSIYVLDRTNGQPIYPITETPVPQGAVEGDHTSPTQPVSSINLAAPTLKESDMWGGTPFDQALCRIAFREHRYEGIYTPPSTQGSIVYPGNLGVFDWGGISVDPVRQIAFLNPSYMAFTSKLVPREEIANQPARKSETEGIQPNKGAPYGVILSAFLSPLGLPCQAPAWGYVAGLDLTTGKLVYKHKNGTVRDNSPVPLPLPMGVPSLGGTVTTAGGVAFLSGTLDQYLRAYDVKNGKELWKGRLPAGGQTTPMTYTGKDGRQYVLVYAGGHGSLGTKQGDYVMAFALPEKK